MKSVRLTLLLGAAALLLAATGCSHPAYYPPPPPPPVYAPGPNPLAETATQNGSRDGAFDGRRDAASGFGYAPKRDRKFHDTPGYDSRFGPFPPYRDLYRRAYLRAYANSFQRHE